MIFINKKINFLINIFYSIKLLKSVALFNDFWNKEVKNFILLYGNL